ncbi:thiol-disulfide oxidoreductase DCC family protein [Denitrificimonas caeni]|uniref:thiol-disulfide oxidoreductase DCC family protein n=1 Tax=Denitrificimonas caeni TaxID=521720 RepID=UPI001963F52D|nr:DUF393 domain-containing protein [Denitrificimonas caeni]
MKTYHAQLYYDASCGLCQKEIEHLRPRLEPNVKLVDISAENFQTPEGYTLEDLLTRIHFFDGQTMHIGFNATLAYWRVAGLNKTVVLLSLPGISHIGNLLYNVWAQWRRKNSSSCKVS